LVLLVLLLVPIFTYPFIPEFNEEPNLKAQGSLGKLITLGSIMNLIIFGIPLKLNQDMLARGIILSQYYGNSDHLHFKKS
jgi:hypothetical protein